jgi:hypothetical protein
MASIDMTIPHQLPQEEALRRVQTLLQRVKSQFADKVQDLHEEWDGNTGLFKFRVMNFPVSGKLTVNPTGVDLDGNIPLAASLFKGKIKSVINEEARKILG